MSSPMIDVVEAEKFEGRAIIRRFTDQLTGANEPQDFDIAKIAREALQRMVNECNENAKPSMLQRVGISTKSSKAKATGVLEDSLHDFNELKVSVKELEKEWKESHGPIYNAFKKLCNTLDDHKSLLAIFPSQNIYTSAAKNHSDIAETLSRSIADISDKVATCSSLVVVIKTQRLRKRLANVYARMFQFYRDAIKWYLHSRPARVFSSFNDNLKKGCIDATNDLEDYIKELYREASVGSAAMVAMLYNDCSWLKKELQRQRQNYERQDTLAGRRMFVLMEASWANSRTFQGTVAGAKLDCLAAEPTLDIEEVVSSGVTRADVRAYSHAIKAFIIGEEDSGLLSTGDGFWVAEDGVLPKLHIWMLEDRESSTLWISSPYDVEGTTSARAAALAATAAAWQAKTPLISHFCQRPQRDKVQAGMSTEQVGLIGTVYSLIHQLLEFGKDVDELDIKVESLANLNGGTESWSASLEVLRALLDCTPLLMYCIIDGLNDIELGDGEEWCQQLLDVLFSHQRRVGTVFNLLLTTAGQSRVLQSCVESKNRHIATKRAREVARFGRRIELPALEQGAHIAPK
ncbi:hypothetical protein NUW58_g1197 [Xylaria curta]|uniref:Uncharacterized protein n=1 Tax=Xylaria curta TaxID=42375 RepID=A0ACC1PLV4_9PEZI|nr:hypothetical protein NUW58_g1197 [Xylaria curta]